MSKPVSILAFAGSLRADSYNKKVVRVAAAGAEAAGATVTVIDLKDYPLPLYDQDIEDATGLPDQAKALKALLRDHDGFIIASPEYNSGISAVLKNTIDWCSRAEEGEAPMVAFRGKAAALISASPGGFGGLRGLYHTRTILANIGVHILPKHHSVSSAFKAFDENGALVDPKADATVRGIGADLAQLASSLRKN